MAQTRVAAPLKVFPTSFANVLFSSLKQEDGSQATNWMIGCRPNGKSNTTWIFEDTAGYFYIVDRVKDMIVTGGKKVDCGEVGRRQL